MPFDLIKKSDYDIIALVMKTLNHKHTLFACFSGYITQSIVVNFIPLLFISFCTGYNISLEKVTMLVTINFFLQLLTDLVSAKLISKIGYRAGIVGANVLAMIGLIVIAVFPDVIDPYVALVIGGGTPTVELHGCILFLGKIREFNKERLCKLFFEFWSKVIIFDTVLL